MKRLQGRAAGFAIVLMVYVIAAVVGVAAYCMLPFAWWLNLLVADVAATVITFIFSVLFGNASVYDPYWSVQPIVIVIALALGHPLPLLSLLLVAVICLWGVRLTLNWAYTFHGLAHQDWRYTMLKETTGVFYPLINFIGIHMVPTLVVYGCVLPAAYVLVEGSAMAPLSVWFLCLSLAATLLQGVSDFQMQRFRARKTGGFIRDGIWKYSRHPNYLGEILMWWGVALAVVFSFPELWWLGAGAAANTVLFFAVSIPMAEKRQGKKPGFDRYRAETRVLLPLPRLRVKIAETAPKESR